MSEIVKTRVLSWKDLVQKAWGKDWTAPEIAYEFTNRKFYDRGRAAEGDGLSGDQYADNYADNYTARS